MAGDPVEAFGGKTTLQQANKPSIDALAAAGKSGMLHTVPDHYEPGSEIANLSVLGYNLDEVFEGRGSLEAASMGIEIEEGEMAMRLNILTIDSAIGHEGEIKNHSAGHISTEEATELVEFLQKELGDDVVSLYPGVSYRHLIKIKGGNKSLECTPPHNVPGTQFSEVMIKATAPEGEATAKLLNDLTLRSMELLKDHPVNLKRIAAGKEPANAMWAWSPGYKPAMEPLTNLPQISSGSVISAVDLIKGIGVYAGLDPIEVDGATGLYDTNYEGKTAAAIAALKGQDFVYLHIEASDEAGHEGDHDLKVKTIENLSERAVKQIFEAAQRGDFGDDVRIALLPDHPTPCHLRTHSRDAVPFVIWDKRGAAIGDSDSVTKYDEESARRGVYGTLRGEEFMKLLLS